jgi:hypothetical protein
MSVVRASNKKLIMIRYFIVILFLTLIISSATGQSDLTLTDSNKNIKQDTLIHRKFRRGYPTPNEYTPLSFIDSVTIKDNQDTLYPILITNDFPLDWVKYSDIDTLISLIKSPRRCRCFTNPSGSPNLMYLPTEDITHDYKANVGGYAIIFINSFRNKTRIDLGLFYCPMTDSETSEELINWWRIYKHTK